MISRSDQMNTSAICAVPRARLDIPIEFIRREPCRKCSAAVWAFYHFTSDGMATGWGAVSIGACGRPDRCGEKLQWLDDGDLALASVPAGGRA